MPELPEVETIVRGLAPRLAGRTIQQVRVLAPLVVKSKLDALNGCSIDRVERLGKFVCIPCSTGTLTIHLGMTGKLLVDGALTPYTRVIFHLDGFDLLYDDIRQFGRVHYSSSTPDHIRALGPDALQIDFSGFATSIRKRHSAIKPLLLNQSVLCGLGNIYVDEALFRAGIHPKTIASRLTAPRLQRLHTAIRETLLEAIRRGGSSISDYVNADGEKGSFQELHQVYGRPGLACYACGGTIRRIVIAQRGTHFCPTCQRLR